MIEQIFCLFGAYILGAVPSAYIAGKLSKGVDLRKEGSGNLGFTNAWRMLGPKWSIPVLIFDVVKGVIAVFLAELVVTETELLSILCGFGAIIGHNWTIFLGFKGGGKGVATAAGVFLALAPISFSVALIVFLLTIYITQYMSLGSILGAVSLLIAQLFPRGVDSEFAPSDEVFIASLLAALLIILRHQSNIRRLLRGTEPKLGTKDRKDES